MIGVGADERFATFAGRVAHRDELDARMAAWIAERDLATVLAAFEAAEAAAAPVYRVADLLADPHVQARGSFEEIDGVPMQGLIARLSETPGVLRWAGRGRDADPEADWEPRPSPLRPETA